MLRRALCRNRDHVGELDPELSSQAKMTLHRAMGNLKDSGVWVRTTGQACKIPSHS